MVIHTVQIRKTEENQDTYDQKRYEKKREKEREPSWLKL